MKDKATQEWVAVGGGGFIKWAEEGQEAQGIYRGQREGKFGPLGMLDTADGRVNFPLHTALASRLAGVSEGTEIRMVYRGNEVSKSGRTFKAFDVFVAADRSERAQRIAKTPRLVTRETEPVPEDDPDRLPF